MTEPSVFLLEHEDGSVTRRTWIRRGRGPSPAGATRELDAEGQETGWWVRNGLDGFEEELASRPPRKGRIVAWTQVSLEDARKHDRRYREAWTCRNGELSLDLPKARELRLTQLRLERAQRFAALDGEYIRAQQRGQGLEAAVVEAEALRAMPELLAPALEAATTADELDAVTLELTKSLAKRSRF